MYGKSFAKKNLNQMTITPIMETPELLEFVPPTLSTPNAAKAAPPSQKSESSESDKKKKSTSDASLNRLDNVLQHTKQIETRTADGKRRVTPITVPRDLV